MTVTPTQRLQIGWRKHRKAALAASLAGAAGVGLGKSIKDRNTDKSWERGKQRAKNALITGTGGAFLGSLLSSGKSGHLGARIGGSIGAIAGMLNDPKKKGSRTAETIAAGGDWNFDQGRRRKAEGGRFRQNSQNSVNSVHPHLTEFRDKEKDKQKWTAGRAAALLGGTLAGGAGIAAIPTALPLARIAARNMMKKAPRWAQKFTRQVPEEAAAKNMADYLRMSGNAGQGPVGAYTKYKTRSQLKSGDVFSAHHNRRFTLGGKSAHDHWDWEVESGMKTKRNERLLHRARTGKTPSPLAGSMYRAVPAPLRTKRDPLDVWQSGRNKAHEQINEGINAGLDYTQAVRALKNTSDKDVQSYLRSMVADKAGPIKSYSKSAAVVIPTAIGGGAMVAGTAAMGPDRKKKSTAMSRRGSFTHFEEMKRDNLAKARDVALLAGAGTIAGGGLLIAKNMGDIAEKFRNVTAVGRRFGGLVEKADANIKKVGTEYQAGKAATAASPTPIKPWARRAAKATRWIHPLLKKVGLSEKFNRSLCPSVSSVVSFDDRRMPEKRWKDRVDLAKAGVGLAGVVGLTLGGKRLYHKAGAAIEKMEPWAKDQWAKQVVPALGEVRKTARAWQHTARSVNKNVAIIGERAKHPIFPNMAKVKPKAKPKAEGGRMKDETPPAAVGAPVAEAVPVKKKSYARRVGEWAGVVSAGDTRPLLNLSTSQLLNRFSWRKVGDDGVRELPVWEHTAGQVLPFAGSYAANKASRLLPEGTLRGDAAMRGVEALVKNRNKKSKWRKSVGIKAVARGIVPGLVITAAGAAAGKKAADAIHERQDARKSGTVYRKPQPLNFSTSQPLNPAFNSFARGDYTDEHGRHASAWDVLTGKKQAYNTVFNPATGRHEVDLRSPKDASLLDAAGAAHAKAKTVARWGGRGTGIVRDAGEALAGKERRRDASGRTVKREWEKPWFSRHAKEALATAALVGGGLMLRRSPRAMALLDKGKATVEGYLKKGGDLLDSKLGPKNSAGLKVVPKAADDNLSRKSRAFVLGPSGNAPGIIHEERIVKVKGRKKREVVHHASPSGKSEPIPSLTASYNRDLPPGYQGHRYMSDPRPLLNFGKVRRNSHNLQNSVNSVQPLHRFADRKEEESPTVVKMKHAGTATGAVAGAGIGAFLGVERGDGASVVTGAEKTMREAQKQRNADFMDDMKKASQRGHVVGIEDAERYERLGGGNPLKRLNGPTEGAGGGGFKASVSDVAKKAKWAGQDAVEGTWKYLKRPSLSKSMLVGGIIGGALGRWAGGKQGQELDRAQQVHDQRMNERRRLKKAGEIAKTRMLADALIREARQQHGFSVPLSFILPPSSFAFDAAADLAGWDLRDPRGRSARVFAPGSGKRERREKEWHERVDNERKLWAVGSILAGGTGIAAARKLLPRTVEKVTEKVVPVVLPKAESFTLWGSKALSKAPRQRGTQASSQGSIGWRPRVVGRKNKKASGPVLDGREYIAASDRRPLLNFSTSQLLNRFARKTEVRGEKSETATPLTPLKKGIAIGAGSAAAVTGAGLLLGTRGGRNLTRSALNWVDRKALDQERRVAMEKESTLGLRGMRARQASTARQSRAAARASLQAAEQARAGSVRGALTGWVKRKKQALVNRIDQAGRQEMSERSDGINRMNRMSWRQPPLKVNSVNSVSTHQFALREAAEKLGKEAGRFVRDVSGTSVKRAEAELTKRKGHLADFRSTVDRIESGEMRPRKWSVMPGMPSTLEKARIKRMRQASGQVLQAEQRQTRSRNLVKATGAAASSGAVAGYAVGQSQGRRRKDEG